MWFHRSNSRARGKERRKAERRAFPDYMPLRNELTGELVGHLVDISRSGFKLESLRPIKIDTDLPIRLEVPPDLARLPALVFKARSRWSLPDRVDPTLYDVGFQILDMSAEEDQVFGQIFDKYGSRAPAQESTGDYLWGR